MSSDYISVPVKFTVHAMGDGKQDDPGEASQNDYRLGHSIYRGPVTDPLHIMHTQILRSTDKLLRVESTPLGGTERDELVVGWPSVVKKEWNPEKLRMKVGLTPPKNRCGINCQDQGVMECYRYCCVPDPNEQKGKDWGTSKFVDPSPARFNANCTPGPQRLKLSFSLPSEEIRGSNRSNVTAVKSSGSRLQIPTPSAAPAAMAAPSAEISCMDGLTDK